ncbi:helix-turn-helix domain-containing protein [Streptomyces sp. NBC_01092]|uniref:TetR/AcrR family transcriptional regulator n=1 Tax=Streptomyces sp. NBC_01092 TaxID=2903748 RepID=UPI00386674AE|nr:TetR/AcrR family transcriptional regulator [Streptomyces sp. NBC_01092]
MSAEASPRRRTGGRSAMVLASIRKAVEELVADRGADAVTIPMVAERAGVNHSSIYRRWGDARTMINDLATYRLDPERPLPETGDLRADITSWAQELVRHYGTPVNAALLRGGAAAAGESESDCLRDRRAEAASFAARPGAAFSGDDVIDRVVAPIVYRVIFLPWTLPGVDIPALVDSLRERERGG